VFLLLRSHHSPRQGIDSQVVVRVTCARPCILLQQLVFGLCLLVSQRYPVGMCARVRRCDGGCQVEIPTVGVAAYLCDVPENAAASRIHGTMGKKRLVAGPGSAAMSLAGTTTAFGISTPVPNDGSAAVVYDLDPELVCVCICLRVA
jgi:hypothetical protein